MWAWETDLVTGEPRGAATTLRAVLRAAERADVACCLVIGAAALGAYGAPRTSADIDFLLAHQDARKLVRELLDAGFRGPPPSSDVYYYRLRPPRGDVLVDVLGSTEPLYSDAMDSAREAKFLGVTVLVPSPEFYALLKLRAAEGDPDRRLRHLGDIQDLLRVQPVDLGFVRSYVHYNEPDLDEVIDELATSLQRAARPRPRSS